LNIKGGEMATVLLVDDDVGLLGTLGLLIAAEGHLVRTATNGRDALRLALESRPDIVVTDCAMPVMDGISLVREMKPFPVTELLRQMHRLHRRRSTSKTDAFRKRSREVFMSAAMRVSAKRSW
jgi:CheY-like chemotaxis protein